MNGCYDLDGKCVNCGQYHPCSCEMNNVLLDESEEPIFFRDDDLNWEMNDPEYFGGD